MDERDALREHEAMQILSRKMGLPDAMPVHMPAISRETTHKHVGQHGAAKYRQQRKDRRKRRRNGQRAASRAGR